METKYYYKAADFLAQAGKFLAKDEARYSLITGLAQVLVENAHHYGAESPWFCTVSADPKPYARLGSEMHAAALRTPPHMVVLAHFSGSFDVVADQLVTAVSRKFKEIPGVVGDKTLADIFAGRWSRTHGVKVGSTQAQRVYKLVKVNEVPLSPGKLRPATEADKDLVKKWAHSFHIDCYGENNKIPEGDPALGIERGWVFFWELNGKPVSMAVKARPTEKGMTVGGVYTPPELRENGYATSCVAEVSRNILQSGKQFCTLYTDLANPTSNAIYIKIGYNPVSDSVQHTFEIPG